MLLAPFLSAVACIILTLFSILDSQTSEEKNLKKGVISYIFTTGLAWFTIFIYIFFPKIFVFFNVPCLIAFMSAPIFFYQVIYLLTKLGKKEHFSSLHYLIPALLTAALFVWSFFIPFDIQLQIVIGRGQVLPEGYELYARFFTSKPLLRFIFTILYYTFIGWLLTRYYRNANGKNSLVRKPAKWVIFLIAISLISVFSSIVASLLPRNRIDVSFWTFIVAAGIVMQHLLLTYHVIRRQYLLYVILKKPEEKENIPGKAGYKEEKIQRRCHSGTITRQKLEKYFSKEKPYLNASFRINDLVEVFDVNRTVLSAFINKTYGVNFSRYVNSWRIKEVQRLAKQPANAGKSIGSFVTEAGFNDLSQYYRVLRTERNEREKDSKKTKNIRE